jgi:Ankyrin repeats (many copies)
MISKRGYSTATYRTLQTAYYSKPTPFQKACYSTYMMNLVKNGDADALRDLLSKGLSPNPCNAYGESLVHMAARRGDVEVLKVFIDAGCCLQVSDDYGRTPCHDGCWTAHPSFECIDLLLRTDARLFYLLDSRGSLPLSYVNKAHWEEWKSFLEKNMDVYFPILNEPQGAPELSKNGPNFFPLPDPKNALQLSLASLVASGMKLEKEHGEESTFEETESESSGSDDDSDGDYDSDDDDSDVEDDDGDDDDDDDDQDDTAGQDRENHLFEI